MHLLSIELSLAAALDDLDADSLSEPELVAAASGSSAFSFRRLVFDSDPAVSESS